MTHREQIAYRDTNELVADGWRYRLKKGTWWHAQTARPNDNGKELVVEPLYAADNPAIVALVEALKAMDTYIHADGKMVAVANIPDDGFWTVPIESNEARLMFGEWKIMRDAALAPWVKEKV